MDRRTFLTATPAALVAAQLTGCKGADVKGLGGLVVPETEARPLVIDTHAHFFNATDLQVSRFVSKVAVSEVESSAIRLLARALGPVLQLLGWNLAPSADKELEVLQAYRPESSGQETESRIDLLRAQQYEAAKTELTRAANQVLRERGTTEAQLEAQAEAFDQEAQALLSLFRLPATYEALFAESSAEAFSIPSLRKFLVEMFQYRHVSAVSFFKTYRSAGWQVHLATPSMVDFDWWLDSGTPTRSSIPQQVAVAERISVLSRGAVHPLVPFDPFRQAVWNDLRLGDFSPLELVKDAVTNKGAMGVKLYPPMGFAIYDNGRFSGESIWANKPWLHEYARRADFGARLDNALDALYEFCAREHVPVMAHSSRSNMAHGDYEQLLLADSWAALYEKYDLQGSFGHFSGFGSHRDPSHWREFLALLSGEGDARRRYADLSYFSEVLEDPTDLVARLRSILFDDDGNQTSIFDRLIYGSDWKMLLMETGSGRYLTTMRDVLSRAEVALSLEGLAVDLLTKALGLNAAAYLGLRKGEANRSRIENFYDKHRVAEPLWMKKVDQSARRVQT